MKLYIFLIATLLVSFNANAELMLCSWSGGSVNLLLSADKKNIAIKVIEDEKPEELWISPHEFEAEEANSKAAFTITGLLKDSVYNKEKDQMDKGVLFVYIPIPQEIIKEKDLDPAAAQGWAILARNGSIIELMCGYSTDRRP